VVPTDPAPGTAPVPSGGVGCRDAAARAALEAYWKAWGPTPEQRTWLAFQSRRFDAVLAAVAPLALNASSRVLDVGAGSGGLSVALKARFGGEYHLADYFEPTAPALAALKAQGLTTYLHCDLTAREPFAGISSGYDLVLFVEVLEHLLVNPIPLLRAMGRLARPGGHLLLTTPNQARWGNRLRLLRGRSIRERGAFPETEAPTYGHVQEYAPDELLAFLRPAGLELRSLRVVQNLPSPDPSGRARFGARLLNGRLGRGLWLGDETVLLARRVG
jgi:2-polyprenyl-3-methyl-5-hydroxy-6-metoxy-1,4-benzoquinol methylase